MMNIIFFGLGSIGRRHAELLRKYYDVQIYAFRSAEGKIPSPEYVTDITEWAEVEAVKPDIAFITNPTFLHIQTAVECARRGYRIFLEKPICSSIEGFDSLLNDVKKNNIVTYIAYNFRFHPVIEYVREFLQGNRIFHASVYNSSYLPDWRPGTDHLKSYSAQADMGGGVILDLSHEFDYCEYLFGPVRSIKGMYGKAGSVTVDAEDYMDALIRTERTAVNLHQNFLSRVIRRDMVIDCEDGCLKADLVNGTVCLNGGSGPIEKKFDFDKNTTYRKQLRYFMDNLDNPGMMNNLKEAEGLFRKITAFKENPANRS